MKTNRLEKVFDIVQDLKSNLHSRFDTAYFHYILAYVSYHLKLFEISLALSDIDTYSLGEKKAFKDKLLALRIYALRARAFAALGKTDEADSINCIMSKALLNVSGSAVSERLNDEFISHDVLYKYEQKISAHFVTLMTDALLLLKKYEQAKYAASLLSNKSDAVSLRERAIIAYKLGNKSDAAALAETAAKAIPNEKDSVSLLLAASSTYMRENKPALSTETAKAATVISEKLYHTDKGRRSESMLFSSSVSWLMSSNVNGEEYTKAESFILTVLNRIEKDLEKDENNFVLYHKRIRILSLLHEYCKSSETKAAFISRKNEALHKLNGKYLEAALNALKGNRFKSAEKYERMSVSIATSQKDKYNNMVDYIRLSDTFDALANGENNAYRFDRCRNYKKACVDLWREGVAVFNSERAYLYLLGAESSYASELAIIEDKNTTKYYEAAIQSAQRLVELSNSKESQSLLGMIYYELGSYLIKMKKMDRAFVLMTKAILLLESYGGDISVNFLFECYYKMASKLVADDLQQQKKYYSLAYSLLKKHEDKITNPMIKLNVINYSIENDL